MKRNILRARYQGIINGIPTVTVKIEDSIFRKKLVPSVADLESIDERLDSMDKNSRDYAELIIAKDYIHNPKGKRGIRPLRENDNIIVISSGNECRLLINFVNDRYFEKNMTTYIDKVHVDSFFDFVDHPDKYKKYVGKKQKTVEIIRNIPVISTTYFSRDRYNSGLGYTKNIGKDGFFYRPCIIKYADKNKGNPVDAMIIEHLKNSTLTMKVNFRK